MYIDDHILTLPTSPPACHMGDRLPNEPTTAHTETCVQFTETLLAPQNTSANPLKLHVDQLIEFSFLLVSHPTQALYQSCCDHVPACFSYTVVKVTSCAV